MSALLQRFICMLAACQTTEAASEQTTLPDEWSMCTAMVSSYFYTLKISILVWFEVKTIFPKQQWLFVIRAAYRVVVTQGIFIQIRQDSFPTRIGDKLCHILFQPRQHRCWNMYSTSGSSQLILAPCQSSCKLGLETCSNSNFHLVLHCRKGWL